MTFALQSGYIASVHRFYCVLFTPVPCFGTPKISGNLEPSLSRNWVEVGEMEKKRSRQDLLGPYAPSLLRTAELAPEAGSGLAPLEAAILFVDISGFSKLTEDLEGSGRHGHEELSEMLNEYFGVITDIVAETGGDIETIAGDGLTAFWTVGQDAALRDCIGAARSCGQRIHETLNNVSFSGGTILSSHAALVAGQVFGLIVGGVEDRYYFLLSGAPLMEIDALQASAKSGETVLSEYANAQVRDALPEELRPVRRASSHRSVQNLARYVPRHVSRTMEIGGDWLLAEFRRATVCFIRLQGLVCNDASQFANVQTAVERTQKIIFDYGGSIQSLTMGDKGPLLLATFGLHGSGQENAPRRAVLAMRDIIAVLDQLPINSSCGIATGSLYCGPIGGETRKTYSTIGSVANIAASIAASDAARIVVDEATAEAAGGSVAFDLLPEIEAKGVTETMRFFRPFDAMPRRVSEASGDLFRPDELRQFSVMLDTRLAAGIGNLVLLTGEPGIGKSVLLGSFAELAGSRGFKLFSGACESFERNTPFRAWREVLLAIAQVPADATGSAISDWLLGWVSELGDDARYVPLLGPVLAIKIRDNTLTAEMTGRVRADNTIELILRLIGRETERNPLVIMIDDVHWIDPSSAALIERVRAELPSVVMCVAARQQELEDTPYVSLFAEKDDQVIFRLSGLRDQFIAKLIARRLGIADVPAKVIDFVHDRAAGNPYFSEEVTAALIESGLISVQNGVCLIDRALDDRQDGLVPERLEQVITSRIDLLGASERRTVKVASVQGRTVFEAVLAGVRAVEPAEPQLSTQLQELEQREILLREAQTRRITLTFKHMITQQAIYASLLHAQRTELHSKTAYWIESHWPDEAEDHPNTLAEHWQLAEQHDKAASLFEKAGDQMLASGADAESAQMYIKALDAIVATKQVSEEAVARVSRKLGDAFLRKGDVAAAKARLIDAVDGLRMKWPKHSPGFFGAVVGGLSKQIFMRFALPSAHPRDEARRTELAYAYGHLCSVFFFQNRTNDLLLAVLRNLNNAETSSDLAHRAQAYQLFGNVMGIVGLHGLAQRYCDLGVNVIPADAPTHQRMRWNELRVLYALSVADFELSTQLLDELTEFANLIGDKRHHTDALSLYGIMTLFQGKTDQSRQYRHAFRKIVVAGEDPQSLCWALIECAELDLRCGNLETARDDFLQAADLLDQFGPTETVWLEGQLARVYLGLGDREAARASAKRGLDAMLIAPPTGFYALEGCAGIGDVFLSLAETGETSALAPARKAVGFMGKFARSFKVGGPRYELWKARQAGLAGNQGTAAKFIDSARSKSIALKIPYDTALADFIGGRLMDDTAGRVLMSRAADAFDVLGATAMAAAAR